MSIVKEQITFEVGQGITKVERINFEVGQGTLTCEQLSFPIFIADAANIADALLVHKRPAIAADSILGTDVFTRDVEIAIADTAGIGYKTAINALERMTIPLVKIYFDGEDADPTIFTHNEIARMSLLEEAQAEATTPFGAVSANELVLVLKNINKTFVPTNTDSPYYGKLRPNILVEPYLGIKVVGIFKYVALGKFWTSDWQAPTASVEASVACYDTIYKRGQLDMPQVPTLEGTNMNTMFHTLLIALGFTEDDFDIDSFLSHPVTIGWYAQGNVRNAWHELAIRGNCIVTTDREGKVLIHSNSNIEDSSFSLTDNDQVFNTNMPQSYLKTFSRVVIKYKVPRLKELQSVVALEDYTVPKDGITLQNLEFTSGPVGFIEQVSVIGASDVTVGDITVGTWGMTIELANGSSSSQVVDIDVQGHPIETADAEYIAKDDALYALIGDVTLTINNDLIQTYTAAKEYGDAMLQLVTDPAAYIEANIRGDPAIRLIHTVTIDDPSDKIEDLEILPIRLKLEHAGGLSGRLIGIKRSARS